MVSGYFLTCAIVLVCTQECVQNCCWSVHMRIRIHNGLFFLFFACETIAIFPFQYYKNQNSRVLWEIMYKISLYIFTFVFLLLNKI